MSASRPSEGETNEEEDDDWSYHSSTPSSNPASGGSEAAKALTDEGQLVSMDDVGPYDVLLGRGAPISEVRFAVTSKKCRAQAFLISCFLFQSE